MMSTKRKITKAQYNTLNAIIQYGLSGPFSAKDIGERPASLASLEQRGILVKSNERYIGSDEQLYTVNAKEASEAYKNYA